MNSPATFVCLVSILSLASSQSFSFSFGENVANSQAFPSAVSQNTFLFPSPAISHSRTSSVATSVGTSRQPSAGRSQSTSSQNNKDNSNLSISSFSFSGLVDEEESVPKRTVPTHRQSQQQSQRTPAPKQFINNHEPSQNANHIGQSPCARGIQGQSCRLHLLKTAMSCTSESGSCFKCQQCGSVPANEWIACCRDHFLCCRSLARSCQRCDQPELGPFCNVAFGKCK